MKAELYALHTGERMGVLARAANGRLAFRYSEAWLARTLPVPLSLSLPVLPLEYAGGEIENWLWGLLPDNEETLRRWARQFQVSARDVFGLLTHLGEDVAGAVQFVRPEREAEAIGGGEVRWLSESELAERINNLREDVTAARHAGDPGRFSLAGAQPKSAFLYRDGRWGVPGGRIPTNRIVKPASGLYDGLVENEHFCLRLAAAAGLNAARSEVRRFGDMAAIVVERYDRLTVDGDLVRVHQEDMCQALGVHPAYRYQNEGGPGVLDLFRVLAASSNPEKDRAALMRALIFNFLIAGTDAHAKNYSVLLGEHGAVRLAPLYDLASMLPYADRRRLRLAMRIGRGYELAATLPRHWHALRRKLRDVPSPVDTLEAMAHELPARAETVLADCARDGVHHPALTRLVDAIRESCRDALEHVRLFRRADKEL